MFSDDADCIGGNHPGAECDVKCSHKSHRYGEQTKYICGSLGLRQGAGFWNGDFASCAGLLNYYCWSQSNLFETICNYFVPQFYSRYRQAQPPFLCITVHSLFAYNLVKNIA